MTKYDEFEKQINIQITMKCARYKLNPEIIRFQLMKNLILIEIPSHHTYTNYVYFKGQRKNEFNILIDINEYLEEGIKSVFTENIKITDDDFIKSIEDYDGADFL